MKARRTAASAVAETRTWTWEEFRETIVKGFQSASRRFWQTVHWLRKGKQGLAQVQLERRTADLDWGWKEHFEEHPL